ncbi:MAG TPA: hypothetical protein PLH72_06490 [Vicinamibacterales bacterium]|nr:hypothetical protein [Vicinamibacterales bacterium]
MTRREWLPRLGVAAGYVLVAIAFTWPLPLHLGSRLLGDPGGDTGVYIWNQWVFQSEAVSGRNPLTTEKILALSQRVDLSQHNYTAFLNLLALPLIPLAGVVASYNLVLLIATVLTALCTYALARLAFPAATRVEAFTAGLAFAWSSALVARTTGHVSLVAAAPLAAFLWCLIKAERTRATPYAALVGLSMAWAAFCDPYFAVFSLMMLGLHVLAQVLSIRRRERGAGGPSVWLLNVIILSMAGLVLGLAFGRGGRLELFGVPVSVRGLYTPVLILTVMVLIRVGVIFRLRVNLFARGSWVMRLAVIAGLACAGPLSPVLYSLGRRMADGSFVSPPILWRSSPRGVDLLALIQPNPNHPLSRWLLGDAQAAAPTIFVEYTAALSLVALAVIAFAVYRARFRPNPLWWWLTGGFAALALGPFVFVGGLNTYVPGPWALVRYVPIVSAVRTPTRLAIVAALGAAVLLAGALAAIGACWPHRRRLLSGAVLALVAFELLPLPRTLYSGEYSPLSDIMAADPRPVRVLNLPVGVRDGTSSAGNFSARNQFEQTRHGKALLGGYLSRISARRLAFMTREYPSLGALITLSEGRDLSTDQLRQLVDSGPEFVARSSLGYVVIDGEQASPQLAALAIEAFHLKRVAKAGAVSLYRPE